MADVPTANWSAAVRSGYDHWAAVYDHDARKKSYRLLADAFGLGKKAAA